MCTCMSYNTHERVQIPRLLYCEGLSDAERLQWTYAIRCYQSIFFIRFLQSKPSSYRTSLRLGFFLCMYDNCVQVETRVSYHVYEIFGRPTPTSNTSTATRRFSSRMSPDKRERYWCPLTGVKTVSKQAPLVTELSIRYL